jgi:heme exporter protein C
VEKSDHRSLFLGAGSAALVLATWMAAFGAVPVDANQGEVYRIMYLHVPSAFTAFSSAAVLLVTSVLGLKGKNGEASLCWSRAAAEVGLMFTVLTLATGSIWGKPTWGTWWTWDARLTTTFLLALLYAGFLMLHATMAPGAARIRACAVLGILIAVDVPIIYESVNLWRTLHQPQSMLRKGGSTMDPVILTVLLLSIVVMVLFGAWLLAMRARNLRLKDDIEAQTFERLSPNRV